MDTFIESINDFEKSSFIGFILLIEKIFDAQPERWRFESRQEWIRWLGFYFMAAYFLFICFFICTKWSQVSIFQHWYEGFEFDLSQCPLGIHFCNSRRRAIFWLQSVHIILGWVVSTWYDLCIAIELNWQASAYANRDDVFIFYMLQLSREQTPLGERSLYSWYPV